MAQSSSDQFVEDETQDVILQLKGKLYSRGGQIIEGGNYEKENWDEKGEGVVKFLKHKDSGTVKLLFLHSSSCHVLANHPITGTMRLEEYGGEENSCIWRASNYQHGELHDLLFRIEFASAEDWDAFIRKLEQVTDTQCNKEETEEATDPAAGFLDKVTASEAQSKQETHA